MIAKLDDLIPLETELSQRRLEELKTLASYGTELDPPVVIPMGGKYGIIDGNHRAFLAYKNGHKEIKVALDNRDLRDLFESTMRLGISHIRDLEDRLIPRYEWE